MLQGHAVHRVRTALLGGALIATLVASMPASINAGPAAVPTAHAQSHQAKVGHGIGILKEQCRRFSCKQVGYDLLVSIGASALWDAIKATPPTDRYYRFYTTQTANLRRGPGRQFRFIQQIAAGTPVDIVCQTMGGENVGGSRVWGKLTGGQWIFDGLVDTPLVGVRSIPRAC